MDSILLIWETDKLFDKLRQKHFKEPKDAKEIESTLSCYRDAAKTGAILFSVLGGKLSEGINFSDHLGRLVVVVGVPFPNHLNDIELQIRMEHLCNSNLEGISINSLLESFAMKIVNQAIGRVIRHANDYAAIILVDIRYANSGGTPSSFLMNRLPAWIKRSVVFPSADISSASDNGNGMDDFNFVFKSIRKVNGMECFSNLFSFSKFIIDCVFMRT